MKIKILSDSTCDLSKEILAANDVTLMPLTVIRDGSAFLDNVSITPAEIFAHVAAGGDLCSTTAVSIGEYIDFFTPFAAEYEGVVHINLGSGFSSTHQNACLAAEEFDNVVAIDSRNLSTGQGLVVLKACELAKTCESLAEMKEKLDEFTYAKCLGNYVKDRLSDREDLVGDTLFVTTTGVADDCYAAVMDAVRTYGKFDTVYETTAGCTISCHCGPGTLGVLFVRK